MRLHIVLAEFLTRGESNGDRRFLRGIYLPLFAHCRAKIKNDSPREVCDTNRGSHSALGDRQARLSGVECRNIRQRRNSPYIKEANGDQRFLRSEKHRHG